MYIYIYILIVQIVYIYMQNVSLTTLRPKSRIRKLSDMTPAADTRSVVDVKFNPFQLKL